MSTRFSSIIFKYVSSNEIDYLAFLGVNTGNIIRYVKNTKKMSCESIAKALNVSKEEVMQLEHLNEPINEHYREKLRCIYN